MKISIPYGKGQVSADIPSENLMMIARAAEKIEALPDEEEALHRAFSNPVGTPSLEELAAKLKPDEEVVILTSDYTRPTPTEKLTRTALEHLAKGGVTPDRVTVLFCSGLHRPMTREEMEALLGEQAQKVRYHSHDAYHDPCVKLGVSKNGTPIEINEIAARAKLKISFSTVEPHHAAGWSGGGKNVIPGISSKDSVFVHHSQMLDHRTRIGVLDGNPFREDIDEIAQRAGVNFICNVALTDDKKIAIAVCGDVVKAHRAVAAQSEKDMAVTVSRLPDIVIAGPGGAPRDNNFWQTEGKAITRVGKAARPGGIVIIAAECAEGVGQKQFEEFINENMTAGADLNEVLEDVRRKTFTVQRNKIGRVCQAVLRNQLFIVCSKTLQSVFPNPPFRFFDTLQEAVDEALLQLGEDARILVVPETTRVLLKLPES